MSTSEKARLAFSVLRCEAPVEWVPLLALAAPQSWIILMLNAFEPSAPFAYECFFLAEGASLTAALAVFLLQPKALSRTSVLPWPLIAVLCLSLPLAVLAPSSLGAGASFAGAILGGCSQAMCFLQCFIMYSRVSARRRITFILLSFALAPVARIPLELIPAEASSLIGAPLPAICFALCEVHGKHAPGNPPDENPRKHGKESARMFALLGFIAVVAGASIGSSNIPIQPYASSPAVATVGLIFHVGLPLLLLLLVRRLENIGLDHLCQIALAAACFSLVAISQLNSLMPSAVLAAVSDFIHYLALAISHTVLATIADRTAAHPAIVFCAGWAPYILADSAGMLIARAHGAPYGSPAVSAALYLSCFAATGIAVMLNVRYGTDLRLFGPSSTGKNDDAAPNAVRANLERRKAVQDRYGLTPREVEVMIYISKGYSKSHIAEKLFISQNTVRDHAKHLYAKLGIHSRNELLELLDSNSDQA